ncbi:hypothetical protein [Paraglaciecola chathamensis]
MTKAEKKELCLETITYIKQELKRDLPQRIKEVRLSQLKRYSRELLKYA